jgi:hypothetical protein
LLGFQGKPTSARLDRPIPGGGYAQITDARATIAGVTGFDMTPEQASHGRVLPDADLPMLAAQLMVAGHESSALIELAGLSRNEATEARRIFPTVLEELGHPIRDSMSPYEELPWRGQWEGIWWAVDRMT